MFRILTSFTGECTLQRNGIEVALKNNRGKTKTFRLGTSQSTEQLPSDSTTYLNIMIGNTEELLYGFPVAKIRKLHSSFLKEGKITLQISDTPDENKKTHIPSDISLKEAISNERFLFVMINNVAPEILHSFCKLLAEIKARRDAPKLNSQGSQSSQNATKPSINSQNSQKGPGEKETSLTKVIRKSTQENDNTKFKVNRGILGEISKNQTSTSLKRNHSNMKKESQLNERDINLSTKKVKLPQSILKVIPAGVLQEIFKYLKPKELINLKLISKEFYKFVIQMKSKLDFRGKGDVPSYLIIKYLNNCPNIEKLFMGPSKFLSQKKFLDEVRFSFNNLKFVDLSWFNTLTDKMVQKIFINCKTIQTFKFAYYSQITDTVIATLPTYLPGNVKEIYFKSSNKDNHEMKENLTDTRFGQFISTYTNLRKFSLHTCSSVFFVKAFANELQNLIVLKFNHILLLKEEDLDLVHNIRKCTGLEFLKIGNIRLPKRDIINLPKEKAEKFKETFQALTKLKTLKIGQFTGNFLLKEIADNVPGLTKLVLNSDTLDDEGLSLVLKKAMFLYHLDISRCRMINGHALENIISRSLKRIIVNFDDYRCRCTQQALLNQGLLGQSMVINVQKRK